MRGWRLYNQSSYTNCRFPNDVTIPPDGLYEIRSGRDSVDGEVNGIDGFVCSEDFIWSNNEDEGWLYNEINVAVDRYCYDEGGPFYCPLP
jgi:hypothetical protein